MVVNFERGGGGVGVGGEGKFKFAERRDTRQHEESTLTCTQRGCDYLDLYKQTMWKKNILDIKSSVSCLSILPWAIAPT